MRINEKQRRCQDFMRLPVRVPYQLIDQVERIPVWQFRGIMVLGSGGSADRKKVAPCKHNAKKSPLVGEAGNGATA